MATWFPRISRLLRLHLLMLVCLCCSVTPGSGAAPETRLALLPVADVSGGNVSWDRELHNELNLALQNAGYAMVEPEAVLNVVRRLRLRNLGEAGSFACSQMGEILGCEYLLSVTITESTGGKDPVLGLLLQLYRAADGVPVWGQSICYSAAQQIGLLGLNSDTELKQMRVRGIDALVEQLQDMPVENLPQLNHVPSYAVQVVDMPRRLLRCGDTLKIRIKVRTGVDAATLYLQLGDHIVALQPTDMIDTYSAEIESPQEAGEYKVELIESTPEAGRSNAATRKAIEVAHVETVCSAPQLSLESSAHARTGEELPVFSNQLVVRPRMDEPRPVKHWSFKVMDKNNHKVVEQNSNGDLPPAMYWRGTDARRFPLPSGRYTVEVEVEDAAGFSSRAATQVYLQQPRDEIASVTQVQEDGKSALLLKSTAPGARGAEDTTWKVYVTDKNGDTLHEIAGQQLPARVELPQRLAGNDGVFCQVYVKDSMGNRFWSETTAVKEFIAAEDKEEGKEQKFVWNAEF
jgi:hypothetical protein